MLELELALGSATGLELRLVAELVLGFGRRLAIANLRLVAGLDFLERRLLQGCYMR